MADLRKMQLKQRTRDRSSRWAVILAGGDGTRLLPLTRQIAGDDRPKQFCALTGSETLLEQTRRRVCKVTPEKHALLLLTRTHERYYGSQLQGIDTCNLLIQPYNHGTAPAITYGLTRLNAIDPAAVVGFFPSDHHFENDDAFADCVDQAFVHAERFGERVILLGVSPASAEQAYGWIEPGAGLGRVAGGRLYEARRFWEKPDIDTARQLLSAGCLWNSFVMVGRVGVFLDMVRRSLPGLLASFESLWSGTSPGLEAGSLGALFSRVPASNFSHDVLAVRSADLAVLPLRGSGWTDLGEPQRVVSALRQRSEWRGSISA
jgi:mannose-1-phosphate guanylyltransferase